MANERLLKRLALWQQGTKTSPDSFQLVDSIIADLTKLLNSQRGNVLIEEDMGLNDLRSLFNGHGSPDLDALQAQLLFQISEFEPRLTSPILTYNDETSGFGELNWRLIADTISDTSSQELAANITIDINGKVLVTSAL
jgi:type VI secretion system lysozyme-like protein